MVDAGRALQMKPTMTSHLEGLLGRERLVLLDGECVDRVSDYESVLRELVTRASGGTHELTAFRGVEGARRVITLTLDGVNTTSFEVQGQTDWLDSVAVLAALNRLLGSDRQLVVWHEEDLGQACGWAMVDRRELIALLEFGLQQGAVRVTCGAGKQLTPVSEDRGGDGPEPWETLLLELL